MKQSLRAIVPLLVAGPDRFRRPRQQPDAPDTPRGAGLLRAAAVGTRSRPPFGEITVFPFTRVRTKPARGRYVERDCLRAVDVSREEESEVPARRGGGDALEILVRVCPVRLAEFGVHPSQEPQNTCPEVLRAQLDVERDGGPPFRGSRPAD